jgi:FkbM family methyltransferase
MAVPPYEPFKEFEIHGETQMMERLRSIQLRNIFDVGCNIGAWTQMARQHHPEAHIHMFELVPQTFQKMLRNVQLDGRMYPNSFGLSDKPGEITIKYVPENDRVSTAVLSLLHDNSVIVPALVSSGEVYCKQWGIGYIDFLKLDTEGNEFPTLKGFMSLLQEGRIGCVQFEYGFINVLTKNLLIDFNNLLRPLGYHMGLLTPEGVKFKDYHLFDENFIGPDYVAVHESRQDIIDAIK